MIGSSQEVKQGSTHGTMNRKNIPDHPDVSIVVGRLHFEDSVFHKSSNHFVVFEGETHTLKMV